MPDNSEILSRVTSIDLYHLFLLWFYILGREPEKVSTYLRADLQNASLCELFEIINTKKYADEPWGQ